MFTRNKRRKSRRRRRKQKGGSIFYQNMADNIAQNRFFRQLAKNAPKGNLAKKALNTVRNDKDLQTLVRKKIQQRQQKGGGGGGGQRIERYYMA